MYRTPTPRQASCFIPGSLTDYIPEDHILRRVHAVLNLAPRLRPLHCSSAPLLLRAASSENQSSIRLDSHLVCGPFPPPRRGHHLSRRTP